MATRRMMIGRLAVGALALAAGMAAAQHAPKPRGSTEATTMNALPPGPFSLPGMDDGKPGVPPGHPTTKDGGPASMPAGIGGMGEGFSHPGGKMNAATSGALRVNIMQGTPKGTAVDQDPVTVELYAKGVVLKRFDRVKMNDKGQIELKDLPLDTAFQPVVTVVHGGAAQRAVGSAMHKYMPAIEFDMKVYDTTETKPEWTIGMRHVTLETVGDKEVTSLKVVEVIGGFNPLDKAWLGTATTNDVREAFRIKLDTNAMDVLFGPGMLEAGATFSSGEVLRPGPMLPGSSEYVLGYSIPVKAGKATLRLEAPAPVSLLAVYAPPGATVVQAKGIEVAKSQGTNANRGLQLLKVKNVALGGVATIELENLQPKPVEPGMKGQR